MRLIFDLDGTLVDALPGLVRAANRVLEELERGPVDPETYGGFVGGGARVQMERLMAWSGGVPPDGIEPVLAAFNAVYAEEAVAGTLAYPGVQEGLAALAAEGHRLGVCTQKAGAPAEGILKALGLMPPIESLAHGHSLPGVLKPDPRLFEAAAGPLGGGPAAMIGDSGVDAETARRAGVPFILTAWGMGERTAPIPHDHLLERFEDLPSLVRHIAAGSTPGG